MTRVIVASTLSLILILSIAGLGLAAPMLDAPFRIAHAAVQVGDFKLSDGGFGSLPAEAACCGSAPGHTGASATVDFGIFSGFVSVHVEDVQPPPQPFVDVFALFASAASDAHDVLTTSAGSRLVLSLLVEGSATAEGLLGGLPGGRLQVAVPGPPQVPSLPPFNAGLGRSVLTFVVPFTASISFGLDVNTDVEISTSLARTSIRTISMRPLTSPIPCSSYRRLGFPLNEIREVMQIRRSGRCRVSARA